MEATPTAPSHNQADMVLPGPGAHTLRAAWGTVVVEVSEDCLKAFLLKVEMVKGASRFAAEKLWQLVDEAGLDYGHRYDELQNSEEEIAKGKNWSGRLILAQGREPGLPGGVKFPGLADISHGAISDGRCRVGDENIDFNSLAGVLDQEIDVDKELDLLAKAVRPGDIVAVRQEPLRGKPGRDIFGKDIVAPPFQALAVGSNVKLSEDRRLYESCCYGYLSVVNGVLSVLPPLRLSEDQMSAWLVALPQLSPGQGPEPADLLSLLAEEEVSHGIDEELIAELCHSFDPGKGGYLLVAQGQEPEDGQDGELVFCHSRQQQPGLERQDGSIDLRELNLVQTVDDGEAIATLTPPTFGVAGFTLMGEELPAAPGEDLKVEGKENVLLEEQDEDGKILFVAQCAGLIRYQDGKISVEPVFQIKGNVDFSTGNVDVQCALEVTGNVCADFHIDASRDVLIGGTVEHGAQITVNGNLEVKGGIIGEKTEVTVLGDLQAGFIQNAKVVVKGNLQVKEYIYDATVRVVGDINVGPGSGKRGGSIVGGVVCGSGNLTVKSSSSPSNVPTTIALEPPPHLLAKLLRLKKETRKYDSSILKIMRTLDLRTINSNEIKELLAKQSPERRELYVKILGQLSDMIKYQQRAEQAKLELGRTLKKVMESVSIQVSETCYGNTKVRMGKREFLEKTDRGPSTFCYRKSRVHVESKVADSFGGDEESAAENGQDDS